MFCSFDFHFLIQYNKIGDDLYLYDVLILDDKVSVVLLTTDKEIISSLYYSDEMNKYMYGLEDFFDISKTKKRKLEN